MPRYEVNFLGKRYEVNADSPDAAKGLVRNFKIEQDKAEFAESVKQSEANIPIGTKMLENIGAGMTAGWEGAKDLVGDITGGRFGGMSDEAIADSRATREKLATETNERVPMLGSALQTLGEIAPTIPLGMGVVGGGAKALSMIPKAKQAMTAARGMGGKIFNPATATAGAVEGGVTGALPATKTDETRTAGIVGGTLLGGAAPAAIGAVKGTWDYFRPGVEHTAKLAQKQLGKLVGKDELARVEGDIRGATRDPVTGALQNPNSPIPTNLPMTTAGFAKSYPLGRLERGARSRSHADFRTVDDRTAIAADKVLTDNLPMANKVEDLTREVKDRMDAEMRTVRNYDDPTIAKAVEQEFSPYLDYPEVIENPEIRKEVGNLINTATRPDANVANITEAYDRISRLQSSGVDHPALKQVKQKLASIIDSHTEGRFTRAYDDYQAGMGEIARAKAQRATRREFVGDTGAPMTTRQVTSDIGPGSAVPEPTRLRRALERKATIPDQFGNRVSALDDTNERMLLDLQKDLERAGIASAEQSPGSISYELAGLLNPASAATGAKRGIIGWAQKGRHGRMEEAMDKSLQSPEAFLEMVDKARKRGAPLNFKDQMKVESVLGLLRSPVFTLSEGDQ